jgi:hypothetical protein
MSDQKNKSDRDVDLGRRGFWRSLAGEMLAIHDELHGIPQQSLRDVGGAPDSVLAEMVPAWMNGRPPVIQDDGVYLESPKARDGAPRPPKRIHSFKAYEKMMVDQYACGRNLQTIAEHVALASGMDAAEAFAATRALFVELCGHGLCHPAAAHLRGQGNKP